MNHLNIYLRKDGRWEGRIYNMEQDSRRYRAFVGHSREKTAERMLAFKAKNNFTAIVSLTFSHLYMEWNR